MYSQVLSTSEEGLSDLLEVFPNPTSGLLKITNRTYADISYTIYSVLGKTMKKGSLSNFNNEIDLSSLNNGIYIIRINQGDASYFRKIILSK